MKHVSAQAPAESRPASFLHRVCLAALLLAATPGGCATNSGEPAASATIPFKIELVETNSTKLPGLHSFCFSEGFSVCLVLGGRNAGLHGFANGTNNFPRSTANTKAYVLDFALDKVVGSVDLVQNLRPELAGPLTASNQEFVQSGTDLYIVGGYGTDLTSGEMTTFGSLIKVDVLGLMQAILSGSTNVGPYFKQIPSPDNRLKVTGGSLKLLDGTFYLVFGQDFTGSYSVQNRDYNRAGGQFQKYTQKVRVFTLNPDLSIAKFAQIDGGYNPSLPYNRRDLNVANVLLPDAATPAATVYGGVFKAGQVAGQTTPIDLFLTSFVASTNNPNTVTLYTNFNQGLSHYDCANLTVFDSASKSCFTTLLGGISQFHYNSQSNILVQDTLDLANGVDGLPFISTISTIQRSQQGTNVSFAQFIQPVSLPSLLGADGQFIRNSFLLPGSQIAPNGVIKLGGLAGRTLVGHFYGGIESFGPYSGLVTNNPATFASSRLFEVYVTPGASSVTPMPPLPTHTTPYP